MIMISVAETEFHFSSKNVSVTIKVKHFSIAKTKAAKRFCSGILLIFEKLQRGITNMQKTIYSHKKKTGNITQRTIFTVFKGQHIFPWQS